MVAGEAAARLAFPLPAAGPTDHDAPAQPGLPCCIRRFLLHVLPDGFHRIRHYGLLASNRRADTIARLRQIIAAPMPDAATRDREAEAPDEKVQPIADYNPPCPCCGGRMILVERFAPGKAPRTIIAVRIDTS